jgi:hypothetical protein
MRHLGECLRIFEPFYSKKKMGRSQVEHITQTWPYVSQGVNFRRIRGIRHEGAVAAGVFRMPGNGIRIGRGVAGFHETGH